MTLHAIYNYVNYNGETNNVRLSRKKPKYTYTFDY